MSWAALHWLCSAGLPQIGHHVAAAAANSLAILKAGCLLQQLSLSVSQSAWNHNAFANAFQPTEGCTHGLLQLAKALCTTVGCHNYHLWLQENNRLKNNFRYSTESSVGTTP